MTESPNSADARRIVDDLEQDIVDVDRAQKQAGADDAAADLSAARDAPEKAPDESDEVPGSPEPSG